ncbi:hypothetical protein [Arthrobacter mangrovi]|uniref:Uncharacterized protein n=1 Tax=Arthrobacter mangrovi TaxID=2966350 RepID=A0ABQ5MWQ6_9MICC|nr:hypothetical protein [Arthrobacter mangrovi]GLB68396.1 hypothetical protein AHIS1636_28380 [Arthrobacter mangrovi]
MIIFSPNVFALERVPALAERFVELVRAVADGERLRVRDVLAGRSSPPAARLGWAA